MTPQEINAAVARRLGWKLVLEGVPHWICPKCPLAHIYNPDWSGSIAAAWEVVEKIKNDDDAFSLIWHKVEQSWIVEIDFRNVCKENISADTAPMAIALAFLKLPEDK